MQRFKYKVDESKGPNDCYLDFVYNSVPNADIFARNDIKEKWDSSSGFV